MVLTLKVFPGERVGLVGETGCGKTTSMKTVLGVLPVPPGKVVSGEILYRGRNLLGMSSARLSNVRGREMTMIFQDPMAALNPALTSNSSFPLSCSMPPKNDYRTKKFMPVVSTH